MNVTFQNYARYDGSIYYAPDRKPAIDLNVPLLGVSGLDNCQLPVAASSGLPPGTFGAPDAGSAGSGNTGEAGAADASP